MRRKEREIGVQLLLREIRNSGKHFYRDDNGSNSDTLHELLRGWVFEGCLWLAVLKDVSVYP
ncbi:MAG: hypothetical protein ACJ71O_10335 [Nitrososphaeraceae archaeon]